MKEKSIFIVTISILFLFIAAFLVYPFLIMLLNSFQTAAHDAFTLGNYSEVFSKSIYLSAFLNSIIISVASSLFALILAAVSVNVIKSRAKKFQNNILVMANLTSNFAGIPLAFAFIILLGNTGVLVLLDQLSGWKLLEHFNLYSKDGLSLIYIYFQLPLGIMLLYPVFDNLDKHWKAAAAILGANDFQYWKCIGLPIISPGLFGVFTIMFANAMGAYASVYALTGSTFNILSVRIATTVSGDVIARPEIASTLAIILAFILLVNMLIGEWLTTKVRRDTNEKNDRLA
ncbi:ABC transporter permease [Streptococcus azizii]|uniref:ABC transporter permease n=1 Tax=Streptococcus azizii TaxID=1579424 RepID=A0AB36JQZ5_9STRE|nr:MULTISPECIES: ABC transporter permease [Streptococcus]MBF0776553.1 ABC transporter permease [Streptococcus sp. 19428wD3_AN2]ONK26455.1 ABC transporter permease [Streptococcus azizii]ONK26718.1 ABC transporter permease [Streptococcus azizii]ONK26982.1 ABC transporter permease [Streptococcus azizii]TFU82772.1 ABC transporter permease [Streptococcus sp. AN2]